MSGVVFTIKAYSDLSRDELYDLLALRTDIFVVEQNCVYPELDYHDQTSTHFLIYDDQKLLAYARLAPGGSVYKQVSIGRVAVREGHRGKGLAKKLLEAALKETLRLYPNQEIKLQAQTYLIDFYSRYGFMSVSEPYPDFGIMHVDMLRKGNTE